MQMRTVRTSVSRFGTKSLSLVLVIMLMMSVMVTGLGIAFAADGTTKVYAKADSLEAGSSYIVAVESNGVTYAVTRPASGYAVDATAVAVNNGKITTDDEDVVWTYSSSNYLMSSSRYLYMGSVNTSTGSGSSSGTVGAYATSASRTVTYTDGVLAYLASSSSRSSYYLTYSAASGTFSASTDADDAATVVLYVETDETPAADETTADDDDDYHLSNATVTLDGSGAKTATIDLVSPTGGSYYAVQGKWSTADIEKSGDITLSAMTPGGDITPNENYVSTGDFFWTDANLTPYSVEKGGAIWSATYTVAEDTPAGTYTVSLDLIAIAGGAGDAAYNNRAENLDTMYGTITVADSAQTEPDTTAEPTEPETVSPTTAPATGTVYTETTSMTAGQSYIIAVGSGSSVNAVTVPASGYAVDSSAFTVSNSTITTDRTDVVWTYNSSGYLTNGSLWQGELVRLGLELRHRWCLCHHGEQSGILQQLGADAERFGQQQHHLLSDLC